MNTFFRSCVIYVVVGAATVSLAWGLHHSLSDALSVFDYQLTSGDLRAIYLPLTAFFYTSQIVSQVALMCILNWQIARSFRHWKILKIIAKHVQFYYAIALTVFNAGVLANIITWWYRLVFSGDRYGYYTTWPSAAAAMVSVGCLGLIYCTVWRVKSHRRANIVTGCIFLIVSLLAFAAEELVKSRL